MIRIITNTGDVVLQPISCILSMVINGVWIVKMEHPYDREGRWQYITEDAVIIAEVMALDGIATEQRYRIHLVQMSLTSIYVEAYPIALDAFNDKVFTSVARNGATPSRLAQDITSSAYPVTTNLSDTLLADYKYENTNLIAIINGGEDCFVEKYGGEIKYNNNAISINNRLDSGNTAYVYAGRDVTSLMHSVNTSDVVTRIYPLSANGMRLNARTDAQVPPATPYVDSQYIDDYGVVHSEFIKTHFMLCTEDEKNADVDAFDKTMQFRNAIIEEVQNWMQDLAQLMIVDSTKRNIEYLQSILKLTKDKNKNSGIIEGLQKAITAELTNVAFKQMVNNWIKEACEYIDNIDAPEYKLVKLGTNQYIYADIDTNDRAIGEWHRLDSKWRWFSAPNGYLDDSQDNNKNWSWYADTGVVVTEGQSFPKLYGSKSDDIFLRDQWGKVNGTWYWFDQEGHHLKPSTQIKNMVRWIVTNYGASSYASEVANMEKQLYEELYTRMVIYCEDLYTKGVDRPKMEINLEAMDISQIEGYQQLQTLSLGNNVAFRNNGTTINERVVELEYDCIRKVNTKIVLGMPTETISAIISRNIETNPALIAGYGVDIDGNVINIASGGGEVKGLRWWEETSNHIERQITSIPVGGWTADDPYLIRGEKEWAIDHQGYVKNFSHDGSKAIGALMHFQYTNAHYMGPIIMSTDPDAVKYILEGANETAFSTTISYAGLTWYVGGGNGISIDTGEYTSLSAGSDYGNIEDITYSGDLPHLTYKYSNFYQACLALLAISNARSRDSYVTGINAGNTYSFYGGYVASGDLTPSNAPFRVRQDGMIYGKDVVAGNHTLSNKQDKLTAGQNVQIEGNTISAKDTTYTAGTNVNIDSNNVISATDTTYDVFEDDVDGLVPAPTSSDTNKFLKGDGTWAEAGGGYMSYSGTSVPSSSLGNDGDHYYRLDTNGNIIEEYIKLSGTWTLLPKSDAVLGTKTITQNGTYPALTDSLDGYSSVDVNVSGGGSTLITKTITQNGTYNAQDDNADGYSQVTVNVSGGGGGSIERLFSASENSSSTRHTDHVHKAYFDDGIGTITEDANYSSYLSYDNSANEFEVLQGFTALIIPWTYEYASASGSYPYGEFYINGTSVSNWMVDYKPQGYFLGTPLIHTFNQGDTFYSYTPSSDGYPEQNLKLYKIDSASASLFTDMFTFHNVSGGVGSIIT